MMMFSYADGLVIQTGSVHGTGLAFLHSEIDISGPVYAGDMITVAVDVTEQRPTSKGNRGLITTCNTVSNQDGRAVMAHTPRPPHQGARRLTGNLQPISTRNQ
jgi:acyl dehydratase